MKSRKKKCEKETERIMNTQKITHTHTRARAQEIPHFVYLLRIYIGTRARPVSGYCFRMTTVAVEGPIRVL
jgi:hypothetical protein